MKKCRNILVAGGYGYTNLGDEAQCETTLELLTKRYHDYQIINLTPDVNHSKDMHPDYFHEYASRVAIYNQNMPCDLYSFSLKFFKLWRIPAFILKSIWVLINAYLIKYDLPTLFLNPRTVKFMEQLREASLFYFSGGGFLTGKTLSRLWDGIVICRLCKIFDTPVVMSGQTIGVWSGKYNEILAKWGFKHVKVITVRDEEFSLNDLSKIGLKGENYFATHDDALHSKKSEERQINSDNYITLNFHYWGMSNKQKAVSIDKINKIVNYILDNSSYDIVLIPMTQTDTISFNDYLSKYPNDRIKPYEFNLDFGKIRRVIADSKMCITMKHHPIIFAMGEDVPTISLAFSGYYVHKNVGALAQYGQEKFSVNLEDEDYFEKFLGLYKDINENKTEILSVLQSKKSVLDERKEKFLQKVDKILN